MKSYLREYWVNLGHLPPILPFLVRHDVKRRSCISMLRPIDIMTQLYYVGICFGAHHILNLAYNASWAWHTKIIL